MSVRWLTANFVRSVDTVLPEVTNLTDMYTVAIVTLKLVLRASLAL
jgi:hypothetical protein